MIGELSVLNVGAGDIKIVFNQADKGESAKAIRMLTDMQRRGYAIMVELPDGSYTRAQSIDATRGRYVITLPEDATEPPESEPVTCACGCGGKVTQGKTWLRGHASKKRTDGRGRKVSVPVTRSRAVGVARSAGG
jgi:hypothetical protein